MEKTPSQKMQMRTILLYEFRNGLSAAESCRKVCNVFGQDAISETTCRDWFRKFASGDYSLEDGRRSGRPSTVDKEQLKARIAENREVTCRELAAEFEVSHPTILRGLHELGMTPKLGKWIPHQLSEKNKQDRLEACISLSARHRQDPFLDRLVTCDEKWVFYDNVVRKRSWCAPGEASTTVPKRNIHSSKVMLCLWWDIRGVIHYELLGRNQTINTDLYCQQLERVQEKLLEKRPSLVNRKGVCFHQDNARPHVSAASLRKISDLNWELIRHPPYSPDLAPSDYHLFRSLTNFLVGKKLASFNAVQNEINDFIATREPDFFKRGIEYLVDRWGKVMECGGEYLMD